MSERPTSLDIDTGRMKMSIKTLLAIVMGVAALVTTGVTAWTATATKDGVEAKITPLSTDDRNAAIERFTLDKRISSVETNVQHMSEIMKQQTENTKYIQARVDFMVEQQIIEAKEDGQVRRRARRAVKNVRARAAKRGDDDPLAGLADEL